MKKSKLFLLLAALLVSAMLLTSCGGTVAMDTILNAEYDPAEDVYATAGAIAELEGYSPLTVDVDVDVDLEEGIEVEPEYVANDEFVVFVKVVAALDDAPATISYKILSLRIGDVVATFAESKTDYDFTLYDAIPMFQVEKTVAIEKTVVTEAGETTTTTYKTDYAMYDGTGSKVDSSKNELAAPELFADLYENLVVYDCVGYSAEDNGALTKVVDIPEYIALEDCVAGADYYYVDNYDSVTVYDKEFAYVSTYSAPNYADECNFYFLNDGNVLVQYSYQVDEDVKKFDYIDGEGYPRKMELVSLLFDVAKDETKELDLDYVVLDVTPWYVLVDENETDTADAMYLAGEKLENTAIIAPIQNQHVDASFDNLQFVLMSNKIKTGDSLKMLENQAPYLPEKIGADGEGTDLYWAWLYKGAAIVDIEGNVIQMINDTEALNQVGQYFVTESAIYDLTLTKVYDFNENDAVLYGTMDNTIFVKEQNDNGYEIVTFCDGAKDTVFTYKKDAELHDGFAIVEGSDCYYIHKAASGDYVYYNAEGTKLVTTQVKLAALASNYEFGVTVLVGDKTIEEKTVTTYYVFAD